MAELYTSSDRKGHISPDCFVEVLKSALIDGERNKRVAEEAWRVATHLKLTPWDRLLRVWVSLIWSDWRSALAAIRHLGGSQSFAREGVRLLLIGKNRSTIGERDKIP